MSTSSASRNASMPSLSSCEHSLWLKYLVNDHVKCSCDLWTNKNLITAIIIHVDLLLCNTGHCSNLLLNHDKIFFSIVYTHLNKALLLYFYIHLREIGILQQEIIYALTENYKIVVMILNIKMLVSTWQASPARYWHTAYWSTKLQIRE